MAVRLFPSYVVRAACECVRLGLSDSEAMLLLEEYNARCQPPWSGKELSHKLADARRKVSPRRIVPPRAKPAIRVVWEVKRRDESPVKERSGSSNI